MMNKLTLRLPWPGPKLWPNGNKGGSWATKAGPKKLAKDAAYIITFSEYSARNRPSLGEGPIQMRVVFCQPNGLRRDLDNALAAMKSALDGVSAALGVDDRRFRPVICDWGPIIPGGEVRVTLEWGEGA
jgi:crossover junction endodeoxyribonuclease RusA